MKQGRKKLYRHLPFLPRAFFFFFFTGPKRARSVLVSIKAAYQECVPLVVACWVVVPDTSPWTDKIILFTM